MASTVAISKRQQGEKKCFFVTVTETSGTTSSYIELTDTLRLPQQLVLKKFDVVKTSGSATTLTPAIGRTNSFASNTMNELVRLTTTGAGTSYSKNNNLNYVIHSTTGFYLKFGYDTGSDNAATAELVFEEYP